MSKKYLTRWLAIALVLALALGFAMSCKDDPTNGDQTGGGDIPAGLVGTWTGSNDATMIINANGSGSFKMAAQAPAIDATYSATETTLTITVSPNPADVFGYTIGQEGKLTLTTDSQNEQVKGIAALSPFTKS